MLRKSCISCPEWWFRYCDFKATVRGPQHLSAGSMFRRNMCPFLARCSFFWVLMLWVFLVAWILDLCPTTY